MVRFLFFTYQEYAESLSLNYLVSPSISFCVGFICCRLIKKRILKQPPNSVGSGSFIFSCFTFASCLKYPLILTDITDF